MVSCSTYLTCPRLDFPHLSILLYLGMSNIGVLVWAVVPESSSSLYKTLVANVEFMRHKVKLDDRFLGHKEAVLELGKDVRPVLFGGRD